MKGMNKEMQELLREVLERIKPAADELARARRLFDEIRDVIEKELTERISYEFMVELEGSVAKGTALRGELDLDIFVLIRNEKLSNEWIEREVLNPLINALEASGYVVELRYASHPYIRVMAEIEVDIVPAYWAMSVEEVKTSVDRTPFHTRFVKEQIEKKPGLADEIRLTKKFFKGIGVYGAEMKTQGFSGYLSEVLTIRYGSFLGLLRAMSKWRPPEVVTTAPHQPPRDELIKLFEAAPLIVPDPVDWRRNAAAAVSLRTMARACLAASYFLRKPSLNFFFPCTPSYEAKELCEALEMVMSRGIRPTVLLLSPSDKTFPPETGWGEVKRLERRLRSVAKGLNFTIVHTDSFLDEDTKNAYIYVEAWAGHGNYELRAGPDAFTHPNAENFLDHYLANAGAIGPWVGHDGVLYVVRRRKYGSIEELVTSRKKEFRTKHFHVALLASDCSSILSLPGMDRPGVLTWLIEVVKRVEPWLRMCSEAKRLT